MERIRHNGLIYYQFENLRDLNGLVHGIFTRRGGTSPAPFDSLNVGSTVGDDPQNVQANRERMSGVLGVRDDETRTTWQVHGAKVLHVRRAEEMEWPPPHADAMITADAGVPLVMRFADCVPLLFYDPLRRAVGVAHAGWKGTVAGVGPATARAMVEAFGSRPQDILVGLGPSIGPCCYEVGPEVTAQVREAFRGVDGLIRPPENGHGAHFDLWATNEHALRSAGVQHIDTARLCTACHTHEFYSHRSEAGRTGRFGAVIALGG
jgi:polyphenol oxidase